MFLTLNDIRPCYHRVESCHKTVPEAIIAVLESKDYEDADTLGAITGSIAKAFYGIPAALIAEYRRRIDKGLMMDVLEEFANVLVRDVNIRSNYRDGTQQII